MSEQQEQQQQQQQQPEQYVEKEKEEEHSIPTEEKTSTPTEQETVKEEEETKANVVVLITETPTKTEEVKEEVKSEKIVEEPEKKEEIKKKEEEVIEEPKKKEEEDDEEKEDDDEKEEKKEKEEKEVKKEDEKEGETKKDIAEEGEGEGEKKDETNESKADEKEPEAPKQPETPVPRPVDTPSESPKPIEKSVESPKPTLIQPKEFHSTTPPSPTKSRTTLLQNDKEKFDFIVFNNNKLTQIDVNLDACTPVKGKQTIMSKFVKKATATSKEKLIACGSDCLCYKRKSVLKISKGGNMKSNDAVNYKIEQMNFFDVCHPGSNPEVAFDVVCCTVTSTNTIVLLPIKPEFDVQSLNSESITIKLNSGDVKIIKSVWSNKDSLIGSFLSDGSVVVWKFVDIYKSGNKSIEVTPQELPGSPLVKCVLKPSKEGTYEDGSLSFSEDDTLLIASYKQSFTVYILDSVIPAQTAVSENAGFDIDNVQFLDAASAFVVSSKDGRTIQLWSFISARFTLMKTLLIGEVESTDKLLMEYNFTNRVLLVGKLNEGKCALLAANEKCTAFEMQATMCFKNPVLDFCLPRFSPPGSSSLSIYSSEDLMICSNEIDAIRTFVFPKTQVLYVVAQDSEKIEQPYPSRQALEKALVDYCNLRPDTFLRVTRSFATIPKRFTVELKTRDNLSGKKIPVCDHDYMLIPQAEMASAAIQDVAPAPSAVSQSPFHSVATFPSLTTSSSSNSTSPAPVDTKPSSDQPNNLFMSWVSNATQKNADSSASPIVKAPEPPTDAPSASKVSPLAPSSLSSLGTPGAAAAAAAKKSRRTSSLSPPPPQMMPVPTQAAPSTEDSAHGKDETQKQPKLSIKKSAAAVKPGDHQSASSLNQQQSQSLASSASSSAAPAQPIVTSGSSSSLSTTSSSTLGSSSGKGSSKFSELVILLAKNKLKKMPSKQQIAEALKISSSSIKDSMILPGGEMTLITVTGQDDYEAITSRPPTPITIGGIAYEILYGPVVQVIRDFRTSGDRNNELFSKLLSDFKQEIAKFVKDVKVSVNKESLKDVNDVIDAYFRENVAPRFETIMKTTFETFSKAFDEGLVKTLTTYAESLKKLDEKYVSNRERVYIEQSEEIKALQAQVSELSELIRAQNELLRSSQLQPVENAGSLVASSSNIVPSMSQIDDIFKAALGKKDIDALVAECAKYDPKVVRSAFCPKVWVCLIQQLGASSLAVLPDLDLKLSWLLELTSGSEPAGTDPAVMDFYMERVVPVVEKTLFNLFASAQDQSIKNVVLQILTNLRLTDKKVV